MRKMRKVRGKLKIAIQNDFDANRLNTKIELNNSASRKIEDEDRVSRLLIHFISITVDSIALTRAAAARDRAGERDGFGWGDESMHSSDFRLGSLIIFTHNIQLFRRKSGPSRVERSAVCVSQCALSYTRHTQYTRFKE